MKYKYRAIYNIKNGHEQLIIQKRFLFFWILYEIPRNEQISDIYSPIEINKYLKVLEREHKLKKLIH
jgi:hypothetical protein